MFSFHRPKVYRSSTGCCICKAKSSSSRFTDSKKYEEDFLECFKLSARRQGEICNACVLLVKRWKKLPLGSERNWQHVVDARAGPGIKSMTKFKAKNRRLLEEKYKSATSPPASSKDAAEDREGSSDGQEEDELDLMAMSPEEEGAKSAESSRAASPGAASDSEDVPAKRMPKRRRYKAQARHRDDIARVSDFVDPHYWKRETVCCGMIFRGMYDEIMIDPRLIKPCASRTAACRTLQPADASPSTSEKAERDAGDSVASKLYSDSSSDSGYDESSNQGAPMERSVGAQEVAKTDD